jgi:hypothetical protein
MLSMVAVILTKPAVRTACTPGALLQHLCRRRSEAITFSSGPVCSTPVHPPFVTAHPILSIRTVPPEPVLDQQYISQSRVVIPEIGGCGNLISYHFAATIEHPRLFSAGLSSAGMNYHA